jgi:hypothetical protein
MAAVNANPLRVITRVICGTGDCAQDDENIQPGASVDNGWADRHAEPWAGTNVQCTGPRERRIFGLSSSGGGLFGRPVTLRSLGRFLIFGRQFRERGLTRRLRWQKQELGQGSWAFGWRIHRGRVQRANEPTDTIDLVPSGPLTRREGTAGF